MPMPLNASAAAGGPAAAPPASAISCVSGQVLPDVCCLFRAEFLIFFLGN
jgi:hypothetical protein